MTIFTVSEHQEIETTTEIDFGKGGEHDIDVTIYEDVEIEVTEHDISCLTQSEASELDSALTEHFPHLREITKADVTKWLAENIGALGSVIDDAVLELSLEAEALREEQ